MEGKLKALLEFNSESILERQLREMYRVCDEIIIVSNQPDRIPKDERIHQIVSDRIPGKGPLSGMHAGFEAASNSYIWVVACDMPLISNQASILLLDEMKKENADAAIPYIEDGLHPLHGVYRRAVAAKIESSLKKSEYKVQAFLQKIQCQIIPEEVFIGNRMETSFVTNVNTPREYKNLLQKMEEYG
ncbi:molybdenum cofactor guanylyltransferase [Bacillus carboniphilus]|uniref:Molybdenum cofactor guanylyltransferase n=2 Tax=Bacillus carboniphilus TaxID=86663 RepID=A0ABN0W4H2_9BACI